MACVAAILILSSCGGGGGGGGSLPITSYGAIDGYVYVPYGSPAARVAEATPTGYKPVEGAMAIATCGVSTKTASTNSSGYFKIQTVPTGSCTIQAEISGYITTQYIATVSAGQTTRVGGAEGITITPVTHGAIRVAANVAGGSITMDGQSTNVAMPAGLVYTFSYVEPGTHTVGMSKSGYEIVGNQNITVTAGQTATIDFKMIPTGNRPPVANAGDDAKWFAGAYYVHEGWNGQTNVFTPHPIRFTLDGSGSSDPDGDEVTYRWEQVSGPDIELSDITASKPVFIPSMPGTYIFRLKVSDVYHDSAASVVSVEINMISGKLAFASTITQVSTEIYTMNADGSGLLRLTENNYYDSGPKWSPDGERIVFTTNPSRDGQTYYVATMNEDGTGVNVLPLEGGASDWSPNSNYILYSNEYNGISEIYRAEPDGANAGRLTTTGKKKFITRYSYDGTKIITTQEYGYDNYEVVMMNSDGGNQTRLTDDNVVHLYTSGMPDNRILYTSSDWLGAENTLYVMNADGTQKQPWPVPEGVNNVVLPVMTDDGRFIFYTGKDNKIHVMYADGSADLNLGIWGSSIDYHPGP
jgi:Tol biopolymer transport system component